MKNPKGLANLMKGILDIGSDIKTDTDPKKIQIVATIVSNPSTEGEMDMAMGFSQI